MFSGKTRTHEGNHASHTHAQYIYMYINIYLYKYVCMCVCVCVCVKKETVFPKFIFLANKYIQQKKIL